MVPKIRGNWRKFADPIGPRTRLGSTAGTLRGHARGSTAQHLRLSSESRYAAGRLNNGREEFIIYHLSFSPRVDNL
jgi:hypothetical protein